MNKNNSLTFALIVLISGVIISSGIFTYRTDLISKINKKEVKETEDKPDIRPIDSDDYILGNPDADVVIIEYSDFECPYCKEFHNTMRLIIDQFGQDSRVAWVYRQSPLKLGDSNSMRLALTSECIGELYGPSKFWQFTNEIFDNSPNSLEKSNTDLIIEDLKIDPDKINNCIDNSEILAKVEEDIADRDYLASKDYEFGTPYNIIMTKNGQTTASSGSIPYILLKDIIEQSSLRF